MNVQQAAKRVQRALRALKNDQGVRARRNARAALARDLRHLRAAVDAAYPPVRGVGKPRKVRADRKTKAGQLLAVRRLARAGYTEIDAGDAAAMAARGVRVRTLPAVSIPAVLDPGTRIVRVAAWSAPERYYIPEWAVQIGPDAKKLALAKRSKINRDAILVEKEFDN